MAHKHLRLTLLILAVGIVPCMAQNASMQTPGGGAAEPQPKAEAPPVPDPLEPVNRGIYVFNDKLYFWVFKPVATGYKKAVPHAARRSIGNFFTYVTTPVRLANCLLQGEMGEAGTEIGRFAVNTTWGVFGLGDPAETELDLAPQREDLGQTLAVYRMPHTMYITWPVLGPSSVRRTIGMIGDSFLDPTSYLDSGPRAAAGAIDRINTLSFRLGEYEDMKEAALDPYIALRDGFRQYRQGLIEK